MLGVDAGHKKTTFERIPGAEKGENNAWVSNHDLEIMAVVLIRPRLHRPNTSAPRLTADALSRLGGKGPSQLEAWCKEPQTHEQLAVGAETGRAGKQLAEFFEDIEKSVKNDGK